MPCLSGLQVLKQLDDSSAKGIPVVIVSSQTLSESESAELLTRASEIVSKEKLLQTDFAGIIERTVGERFSKGFGAKEP